MAARLPPDLLARIRVVLSPTDELIAASDWADLATTLRRRSVDLLIIDPSDAPSHDAAHDDDTIPSPHSLLAEFEGIPVIAYTAYTREAMRALLPIARSGISHVALRGFDDSRARLRDLIDQTAARILGQRLLAAILPRLHAGGAPDGVVEAITRLFQSPQSFRTVPQLARAAGRQRGMLDRWLRRAGLAPAKLLMVAARVAWMHQYAQAPASRFKVLALRLGYPSALPLARHVKWMTGMTPTMLRRSVTADELIELLLLRIDLGRRAQR